MKTRVSVIVVALLAIMCMFSLMGCPKEVDLTPKYITLGGDATAITSIDQELTFTAAEEMSWSLKGCNNGDTDKNNDITYDASNKLTIVPSADGKSAKVSLKADYIPTGAVETARIFATLKSDPYRYGYKDITITVAALFNYNTTGAVNDMGAGNNADCFEPVKDHGERVEQYIGDLYYYSDANGFKDGDEDGGIFFHYYGAGALTRGYSTATTKTNRTDKEDSSGVTYTPNIVSPLKSYIAIDAEDMAATTPNVKLYISAKAYAGSAPVLAVMSDNVDETDITNVTRYFTVIDEKAVSEEKAWYTFVVPANKKVIIANDTPDGTHMYVYDIIGFGTNDEIPALVPAITSVEVTCDKEAVEVGKTINVKAAVVGVDGANKAFTWSSSDDAFATVDASGKVTGVAVGTVTITATSVFDETKTDSIEITVNPKSAEKLPEAGVTYIYNLLAVEKEDESEDTFLSWAADGAKNHGLYIKNGHTMTAKVAGKVVITFGLCKYGKDDSTITIKKGDEVLGVITDTRLSDCCANGKGELTAESFITDPANAGYNAQSFTYNGEAGKLTFVFDGETYFEALMIAPAPGAVLKSFDILEAVGGAGSVAIPETDVVIEDGAAKLTLYKNGESGSGVGLLASGNPSYQVHNNGLKLKNDCIKVEGLPAGPYNVVLECNLTTNPDTRYLEVTFGADGAPETYTADTDTYKQIVANAEGSGVVKGAFTLTVPYTLTEAKDVYIGVSNQWIINKVSIALPE